MAVPSNTYLSYSTNGAKLSFDDIIFRVAQSDTPLLSMLDRQDVTEKRHQWQADTLATPANNAQLEGDDEAATAQVATTLYDNYCQIARKVPSVSGSNDAIAKYGREKESSYKIAQSGVELKTDIEFSLCQNTTYVAGDSTTARQTRGLEGWIFTNDSLGASGVSPVPSSNTAPTDGTQRAFTETLLRAAQQLCADSGAMPDTLMLGTYNRQVVDGFTGFKTRMGEDSKTVLATVEFYIGPFGKLKVLWNPRQRDRTAFLLDMSYWKTGWLRKIHKEKLAKTGDSQRTAVRAEYCLIARNEKSSGAVRDLTTS